MPYSAEDKNWPAGRLQPHTIHQLEQLAPLATASCRLIFEGDVGEEKLAAAVYLSDLINADIYKVDSGMIVSRYVGETEKNIDRIFERTRNGNYLLFFDEADALFGKRGEVRDSHDRYANIEVAYLLKTLEQYPGCAIIALRRKETFSEKEIARFNGILRFTRTPFRRP